MKRTLIIICLIVSLLNINITSQEVEKKIELNGNELTVTTDELYDLRIAEVEAEKSQAKSLRYISRVLTVLVGVVITGVVVVYYVENKEPW